MGEAILKCVFRCITEVVCKVCIVSIAECCCPKGSKDASGQNVKKQQKNSELKQNLLNNQQIQQKQKKDTMEVFFFCNKNNIKIPVKQFSYYVQQLYDLSNSNKIEVSDQLLTFISPSLSQEDLIEYYAKDNSKIEEQLQKHLIGYRRVRVDGNCFYAAFMYQYLEYVLNYLNYTQFNEIIGLIKKMNFQMQFHSDFRIPIEAQNQLANLFADRLIDLRRCPLDLFKQFSDSQDLLFGLSILFIRNLINTMYSRGKMAQMMDESVSHDFLFWQKQFSSSMNEIVIAFLANELKLQQFYPNLLESQREYFKHEIYNEQGASTIHLILKTGHFQIGIPIRVNG